MRRIVQLIGFVVLLTATLLAGAPQGFSPHDFQHLNSPWILQDYGFRAGGEAVFDDYDDIFRDNVFSGSALLELTLFGRLQLNASLPYRWSWAVPTRDIFTGKDSPREEGWRDYRLFLRSMVYQNPKRLFTAGLGLELIHEAVPRYSGSPTTMRDDIALHLLLGKMIRRWMFATELAYRYLNVQSAGLPFEPEQEFLLSGGMGITYLLHPKWQLSAEAGYYQDFPKYLNGAGQAALQQWYSTGLSLRWNAGQQLILKAGVTAGFRNRITSDLFGDQSSFDLAQYRFQIFYSFF